MNYYIHVKNGYPVAFYRDDKFLLGTKMSIRTAGEKKFISDRLESQEVTVAVNHFAARKTASDLPKSKWADIRHAFNVKHGPGKVTPRATIPYLSKAYRLPEGEIRKILRKSNSIV